jgi:prolyl-tRNA synthetase
VPLRVEVGPRDLKEGVVSLVRRDNGSKLTLSLDVVAETARTLLEEIQFDMFNAAKARLADNTHDVANVAEATEAAEDGFARLDWSQVGEAGEAQLKVNAITVRCLQRRDGSMPLNDTEDDLVCIVSKSY